MAGELIDFNPIVASGELQAQTGILGRFRRRQDLGPAAQPGRNRVFLASDGSTVAADGRQTAGERYWSAARSWVDVDVTVKALTIAYDDVRGPGNIGFRVSCLANVSVSDPQYVAKKQITTVSGAIGATLRTRLGRAASDLPQAQVKDGKLSKRGRGGTALDDQKPAPGPSRARRSAPLTQLNDLRRAFSESVATLVGPRADPIFPGWLAGEVLSIEVDFDTETKAHYQALVAELRRQELSKSVAKGETQSTNAKIKQRKLWEKHLLPQLQDRTKRSFSALLSDPSVDNINQAVRQVEEQETLQAQSVIAILSQLIDESKNLDPDDDVYRVAMQAVVRALQGKPFEPPTGTTQQSLPPFMTAEIAAPEQTD